MKLLIKRLSCSDDGIGDKAMLLLLKALLVLFCALLLPMFSFVPKGFFRNFRGKDDSDWNSTPTEEEYYVTKQSTSSESLDFEEKETSFSALRFRFPTYEEFRSRENIDSTFVGTSHENDFFSEKGFSPSNSDKDFTALSQEFEAASRSFHSREDVFSSNTVDPENFLGSDFICVNDSGNGELDIKDEKPEDDSSNNSVKTNPKSSCDQKSEGSDELEWEEQDLIEELQMEMAMARAKARGLPTIPEESEYPVTMEDLKSWKIGEKLDYRDVMDELHRFHKIYREKMRKYDILNYQKMYAIDLMQSKDSLESLSSKSFWLCRPRRPDSKTVKAKELHGDLEMVYVGQLCLSWDFILWQYNKALDLCGTVPPGTCRYNEVAGKFQHFQVLIQRFMENEPFEGSRVEYYAKNRLARRKLLQVPVVREDKVKDTKKEGRGIDDDDNNDSNSTITIDMLVEILQESIRILWQFIQADKPTNIAILKSKIRAKPEYESPSHSNILKEILSDLQKKERKLKKIIKSRNCILKNFKEPSEDDTDDELYFFSQVDLKLVSRVLNMQRITTDQLSWCHSKLSSISILNRKIAVEPSLFPFPS